MHQIDSFTLGRRKVGSYMCGEVERSEVKCVGRVVKME